MDCIEYKMDFISSEEVLYWQRSNSDFICEALENLCGKKFSKHPIIIKKQECYGGETGKYYVSLDDCHDITSVYNAKQEIYNIPEIKVLLEEREQCYNMIQETKTTLTIIEKETFHLGNIRYLDQVIEKLFRERVEEIPKLNETIYRNNERIKKIKKELTIVFAEFLRRHD
jgi:hypothetical protein